MTTLTTLLMIITGIGSVFLLAKAKSGMGGARAPAALLAAVTIGLAASNILPGRNDRMASLVAVHNQQQEAIAYAVGKDIMTRHPQARVLILTHPQISTSTASTPLDQTVLIDALQQQLTAMGAAVTVDALEIPEEVMTQYATALDQANEADRQALVAMESSMWLDGDILSGILRSHQESTDLMICTVDLALDVNSESLPPAGEGPGLVLLRSWTDNLGELFKTSCLDSIVLYRRGAAIWKPGDPVPADPEAFFQQRFLLVTRDNVDSLAGQHSQI